MSLIRIIYISRTALDATETSRELPSILAASRANNPRCGVTGALLVSRKGFAQVLEGPSAAVSETFERIQWDLRHDDVTVLSVEAVPERQFGEWAMACCDGAEVLSDAGITLAELADRGADAAQPTLALLHGAMAAQDQRSRYMIGA
jgi:hypothetical protein